MRDCVGIATGTVDVLTFGIGSGLAGVAGVAVSLLGSVGPNVGSSYIVGCFIKEVCSNYFVYHGRNFSDSNKR